MVAPELLHHYSLFSTMTIPQLMEVAEISKYESYTHGELIFEENDQARWIFVTINGSIDLFFVVDIGIFPVEHKEMLFDTIRPGEIFGISALIEPYIYTSSARASNSSEVIKIDAAKLRILCQQNERLAYKFIHQVAKATVERLNATRLQLAAAWMVERESRER